MAKVLGEGYLILITVIPLTQNDLNYDSSEVLSPRDVPFTFSGFLLVFYLFFFNFKLPEND